MNRKNLTCAVLAGLAGVAGLAGTAQAVNLNPDGLGQVLVYPYYTANDGNQTILSVVNTTDNGKAVKVRFLEGFNSREVLDFNLYLSEHDVWVASIADNDGTPTLFIPDTSCTVPYLYDMGGEQEFLDYAYSGEFEDGGPTGIGRAAEGYFEMIEMGTLSGQAEKDATHKDGVPADCDALVDNWTEVVGGESGLWWEEANAATPCGGLEETAGQACTDTERASGGLFGGASVVNAANGTMYSYDAKAIQGFDKTPSGLHYEPGTVRPSLAGGSEKDAWVFFGVPQNRAVQLGPYDWSVDAVSAVFMHEHIMNEYTTEPDIAAGTEWILTFPTKSYYADAFLMDFLGIQDLETCEGEGDDEVCTPNGARAPFTRLFGETDEDGNSLCEIVTLKTWDREENSFEPDPLDPVTRPPVVSPAPPDECLPGYGEDCTTETVFQLCHEVNVLQFGDSEIFGTPSFDGDSLALNVEDEFQDGWGRINFALYPDPEDRQESRMRTDSEGLVGLPVTGFAAYEFENDFVEGDGIKAYYGGLFGHKGNVRRVAD